MLQAAVAVAAFNLVCTGTMERHGYEEDAREPYSMTLRINLDAGRWCEADCASVMDIHGVTPTQITLQDSDEGSDAFHMRTLHFIDRVSGAHHMFINSEGRFSGPSVSRWEGHCEPAPFTGFPEQPARF